MCSLLLEILRTPPNPSGPNVEKLKQLRIEFPLICRYLRLKPRKSPVISAAKVARRPRVTTLRGGIPHLRILLPRMLARIDTKFMLDADFSSPLPSLRLTARVTQRSSPRPRRTSPSPSHPFPFLHALPEPPSPPPTTTAGSSARRLGGSAARRPIGAVELRSERLSPLRVGTRHTHAVESRSLRGGARASFLRPVLTGEAVVRVLATGDGEGACGEDRRGWRGRGKG